MGRLIKDLHPTVQALCLRHIALCAENGNPIIITQTLRTFAEQDSLYAQGRTAPGPPCVHAGIVRPVGTCPAHPNGRTVTNARGGDSMHNYGLAYDVALVTGAAGKLSWDLKLDLNHNGLPDFNDVGSYGESLGLKWGGRFVTIHDMDHFEFTGGLTLADLKSGKRLPPA